jgi:hypothetical protein
LIEQKADFSWVPWLITVIGWFAALFVSRWKTKQEFLAKRCEEINKSVLEVAVLSSKYHSTPREQQLEHQITLAFLRIEDRLMLVGANSKGSHKIYKHQWSESLTRFRKACTSTHFCDEHTTPLSSTDNQIVTIQEAAHELSQVIDQFESGFL